MVVYIFPVFASQSPKELIFTATTPLLFQSGAMERRGINLQNELFSGNLRAQLQDSHSRQSQHKYNVHFDTGFDFSE